MNIFLQSLIGKTVEFDYGGSKPLKLKVVSVKTTPWNWIDDDGIERTSRTCAISEEGWSWYTINENNVKVISG